MSQAFSGPHGVGFCLRERAFETNDDKHRASGSRRRLTTRDNIKLRDWTVEVNLINDRVLLLQNMLMSLYGTKPPWLAPKAEKKQTPAVSQELRVYGKLGHTFKKH